MANRSPRRRTQPGHLPHERPPAPGAAQAGRRAGRGPEPAAVPEAERQDMYIDALHITGKWADDRQFGGLSFFADRRSEVSEGWMTFGKLEFKVVHGTTLGGVKYLNLLARHLAKVDLPIGGILGLDDHSSAATPEEECKRSISLLSASTAE
ncbi:unnamed protein product [Prorocentrum cordatum]|nr:unnamed protein product [Polarella glacialis]